MASDPVRSGLIGLGVVIGVPILLALLAITVIGIPLSIAGVLVFALVAWVGLLYGRFAVGAWLLSLADVDNRWLALVLGSVLAAVLSQIPFVGGLLNAIIFLFGLGALSIGLYNQRRRTRASPSTASTEEPQTG